MSLFIPITKVDAAKRLVYGTLTEEVPDKAGEILDYATAKPAFQEWSRQFQDASGGKSLGNVRAMHSRIAAGKFTDISFDDENKRISGVAKIIDDDEWQKVLEGVYTGFSIGGGYARRWPDANNPALMRYTPVLSEVSLVDNPAVPTATFEVVKLDGTVECRKFSLPGKKSAVADADGNEDEKRVSILKAELVWLEKDVKDTEEADVVLPHILALQHYLSDEGDERQISEKMAKYAASQKAVQDTIETLRKRVATLESLPLPPKGALRVFSKSDDRVKEEEVALAKLTPEQRVHELMKIALANPIVM
jgi:hypothetical protein